MKTLLKERSMTEGPIVAPMVAFLIPVILSFLFQQFYSLADAVILGQLVGKNALAAVGGSAASLINVVTVFFGGFSAGGCIVISQAFGAKDSQNSHRAIETALTLSLIIGGLITVLGIALTPYLLSILQTPTELMEISTTYLRCYMLGMIPSMLYNMGSAVLRSLGDSKRPLRYLIIATVVNIILDYVFIVIFNCGVQGAAIASVISQTLSTFLTIRALYKDQNGLSISLDKKLLGKIVKLGLPSGLQNTMYTISSLFMQSAINSLGTDSIAAWSAFFRLDGFFWSISIGFNLTTVTFSGQNYGSGNIKRIRKGVGSFLLLDLGLSAAISLLLCFTRTWGIGLFSRDANVISIGAQIILYSSSFYPLFAFTEVFSAAIRGTGDTVGPSIVTLFTVCILRIVLIYTLVAWKCTNVTIALCYPISWFVSALIFSVYYLSNKKLKKSQT